MRRDRGSNHIINTLIKVGSATIILKYFLAQALSDGGGILMLPIKENIYVGRTHTRLYEQAYAILHLINLRFFFQRETKRRKEGFDSVTQLVPIIGSWLSLIRHSCEFMKAEYNM